jgi:hypothetical protein
VWAPKPANQLPGTNARTIVATSSGVTVPCVKSTSVERQGDVARLLRMGALAPLRCDRPSEGSWLVVDVDCSARGGGGGGVCFSHE